MERFSFIFLIAGLGFFILAFAISAYLPMLPVEDLQVQTVEDLARDVPVEFVELKEQYPQAYRKAFYESNDQQTLNQLKTRHPEVFEKVFKKTDEQVVAFLKTNSPKAYAAAFEDMDLEEAAAELYDDPEGIKEKVKAADPTAYSNAFELTVQSALLTLHADYPLVLLTIKKTDPAAYEDVFEQRSDSDVLAEALRIGHRIYIGEACWHCHSQQIRPWGNDEARYGQVSYPEEYHNELNYPPLWGTRRIGPDLIRRGGKQSNDWHVAHFYQPSDVAPATVMPPFKWFYEADGLTPNKKGLSIIAYVQWLGSWQNTRDETIYQSDNIDRAYPYPDNDQLPAPLQTDTTPDTP